MQKKYNVLVIAILFLIVFQAVVTATTGKAEKNYIFDKSNALTKEQTDELLEIIEKQLKFHKENVVIYSEQEALPPEKEMIEEINRLSEQQNFGTLDGNPSIVLVLFVNRDNAGRYSVYLNTRFDAKYEEQKYAYFDIQMRVEEALNESKNLNATLQLVNELDMKYLYPAVSDVGEELLPYQAVLNASYELTEWEIKKDQVIYLLWKKSLSPELREDYLLNYFPSQTFHVERNGVFLLCDDSSGFLGLQMFGKLENKYSEEELQGLTEQLKLLMQKHAINEMVYTLERFLDPRETVPLNQLAYEEAMSDSESESIVEGRASLFDESISWGKLFVAALVIVFAILVLLFGFIGLVIIVERRRQKKKNSGK